MKNKIKGNINYWGSLEISDYGGLSNNWRKLIGKTIALPPNKEGIYPMLPVGTGVVGVVTVVDRRPMLLDWTYDV